MLYLIEDRDYLKIGYNKSHSITSLTMAKESKKQIKAQITNEVRNKYFKIIEGKNEKISQLIQRGLKIQRWNEELVAENIRLKEQLEKYEDWNRKLQEFMDMTPEEREKVIQDSKLRVSTMKD